MATTTAAETPPKTRGLTRLSEDEKEMAEANMGLVYTIARRMKECRLPELDRVQAGALGLMRAAQKFKPELGYEFSTYATDWIESFIRRAEAKDARIHVPEWVRWNSSNEAIARGSARHKAKAESAARVGSLDDIEFDATRVADDPSRPMAEAEGLDLVRRSLRELTDKQREVVVGRFWNGETLKQLGERQGATGEAIRLRERKALDRLRDVLAPEFLEGA